MAWFRPTPPPGSGLHQCVHCHNDFVVPVCVEDVDSCSWHLVLRCGECESYRAVVVGDDTAHAYERDLERGAAQIRAALKELDSERMADQVAAFVVALDRDLIGADDFLARR